MIYRFLQPLKVRKLSIVAIALSCGAFLTTPVQLLAQTSAQDGVADGRDEFVRGGAAATHKFIPGLSNTDFEYEDFDFWSEQCLQLGQNRQYPDALSACEKAISLKPKRDNIELWTTRSNALFQLARYAESLASYNHVVTLVPTNSAAIAYQCASLFQLDRYNDAIDRCEQALQVDGNWTTLSPSLALFYRGISLRRLGRLETALASYDQALRLNSDNASVNAERCSLLLELKTEADPSCSHKKKAMQQYYETALILEPTNIALWVQQGLALEQIGENAGALLSFTRAIDLNSKQAIALAHRCSVLNALEKYQQALESCEQALQTQQPNAFATAFLWSQHSAALLGLGEAESALAAAERAIAAKPDYALGWNSKAVSLWQIGQYEQAQDAVQKAIATYECSELALSKTFQRDYPDSPLVLYRGLILAYFNQGRIFVSLGQRRRSENNDQIAVGYYQSAINAYHTALKLNGAPHINRGSNQTIQACSSNPSEFVRQTSYVHQIQPVNSHFMADIHVNKASAHIQWYQSSGDSRSLNAALRDLEETIDLNPDSFAGWYNRGLAYAYLSRYGDAINAYAQANLLSPNNIYALTGQGMAMVGLGKLGEAIAMFNQALAIDPNYQPALQQREQALQQLFQRRENPNKR
jgi:tetratricopeptide (TPR) repeat protein